MNLYIRVTLQLCEISLKLFSPSSSVLSHGDVAAFSVLAITRTTRATATTTASNCNAQRTLCAQKSFNNCDWPFILSSFSTLLSLSHTHMHTHLGTFTLSISMWQSAAAAGAAFECCAWYAAFGKCEYELHKSSRGNGGSLCQLRQARPDEAGTAQASPGFTAFRLRTAKREHKKGEKTQSSSRREQQSSAPLALVRATASPAMGDI